MDNIESLIFYLSLFVLSALLIYIGGKRRNAFYTVVGLAIPMLISGLRHNVGTDYQTYTSLYDAMSGLSFESYANVYGFIDPEPTLFLTMKVSSFLTNGPMLFFMFYSFMTILFFYLGLRRYKIKHQWLVFLLYLLTIFPLTFNMVRQGVAISICFYAFSFILERNFKKYLLWIIVAGLFHFSALMMLPVYLINHAIKNSPKGNTSSLGKTIALSLIIIIVMPIALQLLAYVPILDKYARYTTLGVEGEVKNYSFYLKLIFAVIIAGFYKRLLAKEKKSVYYYAFVVFEIALLTVGFSADFMRRIASYFSVFALILLANIGDAFADKLGKHFVYSLLILYGLAYFILAYYIFGNSNIFPYNSVMAAGI